MLLKGGWVTSINFGLKIHPEKFNEKDTQNDGFLK